MASLLNTGLDRETLGLCVSLCERGVNPEALAVSFFEREKEKEKLNTFFKDGYKGFT